MHEIPTRAHERAKNDESGFASAITALILAVPLLMLTGLTFFNSRLAQTDHTLSWAANSAARAGANCQDDISNLPLAPSQPATRPCSLRQASLAVEETARALTIGSRRLLCNDSASTGMRVEFQDAEGSLIYGYTIGPMLFNNRPSDPGPERQWPDTFSESYVDSVELGDYLEANEISSAEAGDLTNQIRYSQDLLEENRRQDFNRNPLFLQASQGLSREGDSDDTPNPATFESSMTDPRGDGRRVDRVQVTILCDYTRGGSTIITRNSNREASALAIVPAEMYDSATTTP